MKKIIYAFAVICAFLTVSCAKEPVAKQSEDATPAMRTVTISATVDEPLTKTSYADGTTFSWTAGDQISVYCSDGNAYTFTAASSAATSTFTGSIPEGVSLGDRAFFPAYSGHDLAGYFYNIPETKDMTGHPSADIPMIGDKGEGDSYAFKYCCGSIKLTFTNIPAQFTSVEISVYHPDLKISGDFKVFISGGYWKWNPDQASTESERNFTRKVVVENGEASIYVPYSSDGQWWGKNTVNVTGYDASNNATALVINKKMSKSLGYLNRAHVKPITPLAISNLQFIDWTDATIPSFGSSNERIKEWKATSDDYYIYFRYKITASKIKWDSSTGYDKSYIYTGFDLDSNGATGSAPSGGMTLSGAEARSLVYPFTGTTEGTIEFKSGEDPRSYIEKPVGALTELKVATMGELDGSFAYVSTAISRTALGSPASGATIDIQHAMDYYPTDSGSITLK